jgi:predicted nucleic acid-binding protein
VLQWLDGIQPGAGKVDALMANRPIMSWINLGEVHYILLRRGLPDVDVTMRQLRRALTLDLPSPELVTAAARIKAAWRVAYADAFAVATANSYGATLATGDPEIINGDKAWGVEDLR